MASLESQVLNTTYNQIRNLLSENNKELFRNHVHYRFNSTVRNQLQNKFLSDITLSDETRLLSVFIFINTETQEFSLNYCLNDKFSENRIIDWLLEFTENIQTLNLSHFYIHSNAKNQFIALLNKNDNLISLKVACRPGCAIFQLLLEDSDLNDKVKTELAKIVFIDINDDGPNLIQPHKVALILVDSLPNVQCLGNYLHMEQLLLYFNHTEKYRNIKLNLIEFNGTKTNKCTLNLLSRYCPKLKCINLDSPKNWIDTTLSPFQELTSIYLRDFGSVNLNAFLDISEHKITELKLYFANDILNITSIMNKCHELEKLSINGSCVVIDVNDVKIYPKIKQFRYMENTTPDNITILSILEKMPNVEKMYMTEGNISFREIKKIILSSVWNNVRELVVYDSRINYDFDWIEINLPNLEYDMNGNPI